EALHAVFLFHARQAGMDMAIVNPAAKVMYADIPKAQLEIIEEVVLHPSTQATERLIALAGALQGTDMAGENSTTTYDRGQIPLENRIVQAVLQGSTTHLESDLDEALSQFADAVDIIEGPLMNGMNLVGKRFGEGKMFLPQVVKAARTMKHAVTILQPYLNSDKKDNGKRAGKILLATVKGDVHDIGKNIVSVVMACNGFETIDLGVMVPAETIVQEALRQEVDAIGLSGLITPSLEEMTNVARLLRQANVTVPLMIGGATTSALHTAVKIAPLYGGPVLWIKDASQNAPALLPFLNTETRQTAFDALKKEQECLRQQNDNTQLVSIEEARSRKLSLDWS
ncbi:MAG: B12-binding domain-containing protein, partial [Bacteroidaceae bacterium]|nr:B12-binding domain-containing protein [Bacteroidaceae bacterium]